MIISKDLFLLGEQDYLRLPKDEKRKQHKEAVVVMGKKAPDDSRFVFIFILYFIDFCTFPESFKDFSTYVSISPKYLRRCKFKVLSKYGSQKSECTNCLRIVLCIAYRASSLFSRFRPKLLYMIDLQSVRLDSIDFSDIYIE